MIYLTDLMIGDKVKYFDKDYNVKEGTVKSIGSKCARTYRTTITFQEKCWSDFMQKKEHCYCDDTKLIKKV